MNDVLMPYNSGNVQMKLLLQSLHVVKDQEHNITARLRHEIVQYEFSQHLFCVMELSHYV